MNLRDIILSIFINIAILECSPEDCDYQSKYVCYAHESHEDGITTIYNSNATACSLSNIPDVANYTLIASRDGSLSTGIIRVNISIPTSNCRYLVALLVNNNITNADKCDQHGFENALDRELHSPDRSICVARQNSTEHIGYYAETCKSDNIAMYFRHIYTGCYALRYTIDNYKYMIRSKKYIETNYKREEFEEPTFQCTYDNRNDVGESTNLVTFNFVISILSGSSSMTLKLNALPHRHENKEDACSKYSSETECAWEIINGKLRHMIGIDTPNGYCNALRVRVDNGADKKNIECSFALPVSYNDSYCFHIHSDDERCSRNSVWNPPPRDDSAMPCSWMSRCIRYQKGIKVTDYTGQLQETKIKTTITSLLFPVAIGLICFILIVFGGSVWIHRVRVQRNAQQAYTSANMGDLQIMKRVADVNEVETDEDNGKCGEILDDRAIVLLYAKGSKSFMAFMSDFREILKLYCSCHIYDWYAACEWDAVARVGACEWATKLFKKNHRTVWIDMPNARSLITAQVINNVISTNDGLSSLDNVSDFRDVAFPVVLDCAKRSIVDAKLQYSKHFIVRFEGYNDENATEDPFADLSPHARYLIPYHLSQLCSHLSSKRSDNFDHALMTEEPRLREQLLQMKNDF